VDAVFAAPEGFNFNLQIRTLRHDFGSIYAVLHNGHKLRRHCTFADIQL